MAVKAPTTTAAASAIASTARGGGPFTPGSARKWVLTSALVTGLIYLVRHLVEGETSPAPATNAARQFLGQGSPPSLRQWFVAYATSYFGLALLAVAAPEIAASLAIFVLVVTLVESGGQFAGDLKGLESGSFNANANAASVLAQSQADQNAMFKTQDFPLVPNAAVVWNGGTAPTPSSVGAAVKSDLNVVFVNGKPTPIKAKATPPANGGLTGYHYDPATGEEVANG